MNQQTIWYKLNLKMQNSTIRLRFENDKSALDFVKSKEHLPKFISFYRIIVCIPSKLLVTTVNSWWWFCNIRWWWMNGRHIWWWFNHQNYHFQNHNWMIELCIFRLNLYQRCYHFETLILMELHKQRMIFPQYLCIPSAYWWVGER